MHWNEFVAKLVSQLIDHLVEFSSTTKFYGEIKSCNQFPAHALPKARLDYSQCDQKKSPNV